MSDGKHTGICDEETHQKLDRNWWDYTPCPKCGAEPVWDSQTLADGDEWPLLMGWGKPGIVTSWTNPTATPLEDLKSYRDKILNDCLNFTTIPSKFLNGNFNCDEPQGYTTTDPAAGRDWTTSNIIDSVRRIRELIPQRIKPDFGKIIVSKSLCMKTFIRFRRNHRKARINKKWHKKYGAITRCVANPVEIKGMGFFMCPCRERELKESIKNPMLPTV